MSLLDDLLARQRSGELSFDEFVTQAAENYAYRDPATQTYPETDGNEDVRYGVSSATIENAVSAERLTRQEADAIYAALPPRGT